MRRLMFTVLITAASAIAPISARAAEHPMLHPMLVEHALPSVMIEDSETGKTFAIGAGVVIAATAASLLSFRAAATIVAGVAGGFVGAWWYGSRSDFATLDPRQP